MHFWRNPRAAATVHSLLKALYSTLAIFVALFVLFHICTALYASYLLQDQTAAFNAGIRKEQAYLTTQGDELAESESLKIELLNGDREDLIVTLQTERVARAIGLMGVADKDGTIIGRTFSPGKYGDNVYLTTPVGRAIAQGRTVQSIEETSFGGQLFMTTGRPIQHDGEVIGALFANHLLNDEYAVRFKNSYLFSEVEVVFYLKDFGIYGSSFEDPLIKSLVNSYFNSGSEWVRDGVSEKTVALEDGSTYIIANITFPGLEQSPGGALLFIPRKDISSIANIVTASLTLLVFLFLAFRHHCKTCAEERGWSYYLLLACFSVPVLGLTSFALTAQTTGRILLEHIPYALYNSTLRLQPEWGIFDLGVEQRFGIIVDTGDEQINAVHIVIKYDPTMVKMEPLDMSDSVCSYVVENKIDQKAGIATLDCAIINPLGGTRSFKIADLVVMPLHAGSFTLSFDEESTRVLAHDGLGTDVLRMSQNGSYRVNMFSLSPSLENAPATGTRSFIVFSPTHPNETRWYNKTSASFVWRSATSTVYNYAFDSLPDTIPSKKQNTLHGSRTDIDIPGDGTFYFHLQAVSGGPVAHYRIQSDTTPPAILGLKMSPNNVYAGDVVRFSFEADDPKSGVQRNYYIDLGNHLFLPVGTEIFVPFLEPGEQKIILRVYDGAGNYTEKTATIHVLNPR